MSVSWVDGTVEAVAADLLRSWQQSVSGDSGIVYAAAIGMITGLAHGYTPGRTLEQNMADIRTVCTAVDHVITDCSDRA